MSIAEISFAQGNINKGDWMLGGDAGFESRSIKQGISLSTRKDKYFYVAPNVGYFFINQLAGGLRMRFHTETFDNEIYEKKGKVISINAGPFLRYYFLPSTQKLNVFVDGAFGFGGYKYTPPEGNVLVKYKASEFALTGGAAYFVSPSVAVEATLGYKHRKEKYTELNKFTSTSNIVAFNIGFQIHLAGNKMKTTTNNN